MSAFVPKADMDRCHRAHQQACESGWGAWRIAYGFAASNFFSGWEKEQQLRSQTQRPEGSGRCGSLDVAVITDAQIFLLIRWVRFLLLDFHWV